MASPSIVYDQRWCGNDGIGRVAREIKKFLPSALDVPLAHHPLAAKDCYLLSRALRQMKAELYISPGFNAPFRPPCETVITIHDLIHVNFPHERSFAKGLYYRYIQRPVVRAAKLTLTVSEHSKSEIVDWYGLAPERVAVIGNGISESFMAEGEKITRPKPYLLYVGNAKPHKNVSFLLHALKSTAERHELELVMIARPNEELTQQIRSLQLDKHVSLVHGISDLELAKYYRGALCLVYPSLYEGFGFPAAEAMACGCPVLASDRTSLPEIVGDAGQLFDPFQVDDLVAAIESMVSGSTDRTALIEKGLARASCYTWAAVRERLRQAFDRAGLPPL